MDHDQRLSPELESFIEREIRTGRFADRDAVLEHALRLMQRDQAETIAGIRAGLEDVRQGRTQPLANVVASLRGNRRDPADR